MENNRSIPVCGICIDAVDIRICCYILSLFLMDDYMIIYIVQFSTSDYESTYVSNIKAFTHRKDAELFITKLELENLELNEKIEKLNEKKKRDEVRIRSLNVTDSERMELIIANNVLYENIRRRYEDEAENDGLEYIVTDVNDGIFEIEELELFERFIENDEFEI